MQCNQCDNGRLPEQCPESCPQKVRFNTLILEKKVKDRDSLIHEIYEQTSDIGVLRMIVKSGLLPDPK